MRITLNRPGSSSLEKLAAAQSPVFLQWKQEASQLLKQFSELTQKMVSGQFMKHPERGNLKQPIEDYAMAMKNFAYQTGSPELVENMRLLITNMHNFDRDIKTTIEEWNKAVSKAERQKELLQQYLTQWGDVKNALQKGYGIFTGKAPAAPAPATPSKPAAPAAPKSTAPAAPKPAAPAEPIPPPPASAQPPAKEPFKWNPFTWGRKVNRV